MSDFVTTEVADKLLEHGLNLQLVEKPTLQIYGKEAHSQRSVGLFSDTVEGYAFSGQIQASAPLTEPLRALLNLFNRRFSTAANAILVNRYGPSDYISAHSDKKTELVNGLVLILSVGGDRTMKITSKNKADKKLVVEVPLRHGEFLCMDGDFQTRYKHAIDEGETNSTIRVSFSARQHATGPVKSKATVINQTPTQKTTNNARLNTTQDNNANVQIQ